MSAVEMLRRFRSIFRSQASVTFGYVQARHNRGVFSQIMQKSPTVPSYYYDIARPTTLELSRV